MINMYELLGIMVIKQKCCVTDQKGNHCPNEPKNRINDNVYLCDNCIKNYNTKQPTPTLSS